MDISSIRLFVEVYKYGSYAIVARQREIDPSKVSRVISSLESELGFRLFQRTTRKLVATEAGSLFFSQVEGLIDQFESAAEQAQDILEQPRGKLRVSACTSFGQRVLVPHLSKLKERYPDLKIELLLADHQVDIIEEKVDLAIRFGSRPTGNFISCLLSPRQFRVCASPAYLEKHGRPEMPEDLKTHDCVLFSGYDNMWKFRKNDISAFSVPVSGHFSITHGMTITACAVAGIGIALIPDWLCNAEIEKGDLIDIFSEYECAGSEFDTGAWLVYPSRGYIPLKLRVLIDFLKQELKGYAV
ncbi:MAG: LysR family transcriptional regulator [Robiginitomaculum sp.]|nr:MAG: LysR family transcriptional regulator [Robiginitomaculum sp.]